MDDIGDSLRQTILEQNVEMLLANKIQPTALANGLVPVDIDVTPMDNSKFKKEGVSRTYKGVCEEINFTDSGIFQYLYMVLLHMPDYMNSSAGIEQLMPWSEFIKEQCSGLIDVESNVPEKRIPLPHR
jgi:hypothetical protein